MRIKFFAILMALFFVLSSNLFAAGYKSESPYSQPAVATNAIISLELPAKSVVALSVETMPGKNCDIVAVKILGIRVPIFGIKSKGFVLSNIFSRSFPFTLEVKGVGLLNVHINGKFSTAYLIIDGKVYPLPSFPPIPSLPR